MEARHGKLEEMEALERSATQVLWSKKRARAGHRLLHLELDHRLAKLVRRCAKAAGEAIASPPPSVDLSISDFYEAKQRLDDHANKYADADADTNAQATSLIQSPATPFLEPLSWSGEERLGRFLDLHASHRRYCAMLNDKTEPKSYSEFLDALATQELVVSHIPLKVKPSAAYLEFLDATVAYLMSFHKRTHALVILDNVAVEQAFLKAWENGKARGWERDPATTAADMIPVDQLERELLVRGLKAGGREQERRARLQTALESCNNNNDKQADKKKKKKKNINLFDAQATARKEHELHHLVTLLEPFWVATKQFVTRKQTLTYQEVAKEDEEETAREQKFLASPDLSDEEQDLSQEDDLTSGQNNASKYIDGQPMQSWMYKLYGLSKEYNCEICGNYTYRGRRAFDRHFQDARHAHAMRLLGIPNTAHFHEITNIQEARKLYQKLQQQIKRTAFDKEKQQQVEDKQGNVYAKNTYEDLKRQGLVE